MRKKFLAALLAVCMVASLLVAPTSAATFDDVDDSHWAAGAIERWADYGVLNGHGDGNFGPEQPMTRAQFASMVVNLLGLTNKSGITFPDVEADSSLDWAKDVIDIAATNGIITGYSDGSFGGQRSVTFTAGATMLSRALGLVSVEESSGTGYATAAVEKLTELDMLDENVNGEMTFDRAGVAGLADNMIAYYATEDKPLEEAITGEVKGVILAVGTEVVIEDATIAAPVLVNEGASVEIKNSTVSAPIVVTSAEVTLTGTTAEDVKVSGDNAAVTADKDSSVADVTVEGTAPAIELNGEVKGNVTVAEGTTGVEIKGDGVSADNVVNNTTEDITVNGEAVEGKPVEENPDDKTDDDGTVIPSVPSNPGGATTNPGDDVTVENPTAHQHNWVIATNDNATHKKTCTTGNDITGCGEVQYEAHSWDEGTGKCSVCGATKPTVTEGAPSGSCTDTENGHSWDAGTVTKAATCEATGTKHYVCNTCQATRDDTIPALGHAYDSGKVTQAATCGADGVRTYTCANDPTHTKTEDIKATGAHTYDAGEVTTQPTCIADGVKTFTCTGCDATTTAVVPATGVHVFDASKGSTYGSDANQHWLICATDGCSEASTTKTNHSYTVDGTGENEGKKVCVCGAVEPKVEQHVHNSNGVWAYDATQHWHKCDGNEADCASQKLDAANHDLSTLYTTQTCTCGAAGTKDVSTCPNSANHGKVSDGDPCPTCGTANSVEKSTG